MFKSGFATIIGQPNVGKSTFVNTVLGKKVVITSDKPQTTRNNISGIYTSNTSQIIFIDTPGIHKPHHKLGEYMTKEALNTLNSVDLILFMVDATKGFKASDDYIVGELERVKAPVFLLLNKVDLIKDVPRLHDDVQDYKKAYPFKGIFSISALRGDNVDKLIQDIEEELEEGPKYYPDDQITDHPERFIVGELIREKVLRLTHEEVPHSVMCQVDFLEYDETNPKLLNIHASIIVERDSQKGIIIGKGGKMIKRIGSLARQDILHLLGNKVFLDLHVKVVKDWRNKAFHLKSYGYTNEK